MAKMLSGIVCRSAFEGVSAFFFCFNFATFWGRQMDSCDLCSTHGFFRNTHWFCFRVYISDPALYEGAMSADLTH